MECQCNVVQVVSVGIKSLKQFRSDLPTTEALLQSLQSDIICFQEVKTSRSKLDSDIAIVPDYDGFFTFSKVRMGYSGVATYAKSPVATPLDAEEGISGRHGGKLSKEEAAAIYEELYKEYDDKELQAMDAEGRVVITDHGLFVLFNVYVPNSHSEDREHFKLRFLNALEIRTKALLSMGREVIIVGDLNICHRPIDHCDPENSVKEAKVDAFGETPSRRWLEKLVGPDTGCMVDVFRHFWPTKRGAFTCWNTLIDGRKSNFGTRIDYILCSPNLIPWFKSCSIDSKIMGSDHCPVSAEFHSTHPETGVSLMDAMLCSLDSKRDPPKLCARYWDEFSGKQSSLKQWVVPKLKTADSGMSVDSNAQQLSPPCSQSSQGQNTSNPTKSLPEIPTKSLNTTSSLSRTVSARRSDSKSSTGTKKQANIASFFTKTQSSSSTLQPQPTTTSTPPTLSHCTEQTHNTPSFPSSEPKLPVASAEAAASAWKNLLAPPTVPKCYHNESAKEFKVNKPGPNRGRIFYLCARPVGPSDGRPVDSDEPLPGGVVFKGRRKITEFRCDFFQFKKGVKRKGVDEEE
ncbi:Class II abasic (AP) endonuclease [Chytridiales sp. JEL 0842]|nr:Class II abasic (AP) endonuclease [Chytridiales sp. JEL 0842]